MKKIIIAILIIVALAVVLYVAWARNYIKDAEANMCKHENAECFWNRSHHDCCPGLDCSFWKFSGWQMRFKCTNPLPTPTFHPTSTPKPTESSKPTDSPEPTEEPEPTAAPTEEPKYDNFSEAGTPQCEDKPPVYGAVNFHILRNGDVAIAKWFPIDGNLANIYYKNVNANDWQYSVAGIPNNGYYEIKGLKNMDITFALQLCNGCGCGELTRYVVDGDTNGWMLFR